MFSGANPNTVDAHGNTPLHVAVSEKSIKCVRALVNQENYSSDVNLSFIDTLNDDGLTAMHLAIRMSQLSIFQMLEAAGASVLLCESKQGDSVLHMAVQEDSVDFVHHLLNHSKVDVSIKNNSNYTALGLAVSADPQHPNIIKMLAEHHEEKFPITFVSVKSTYTKRNKNIIYDIFRHRQSKIFPILTTSTETMIQWLILQLA